MMGTDVQASEPLARKVFVSHSSRDKPAVRALVDALLGRGIEAWYDGYEIWPGDSIVARINEGLDQCDVGLVVFSAHTADSRWVEHELATLFYQRVAHDKPLIPVILGEDVPLPPLIQPLLRVPIRDVDRIADAIHHRRVGPARGAPATIGGHEVVIALARDAGAIQVGVTLDGAPLASCIHPQLPRALRDLHAEFLAGFRHAVVRSPRARERTAREASIAQLGRAMAAFCLPGDAADRLAALLEGDGQVAGAAIEVAIESDQPDLLSLPYEALRLPPGDRLLVDHPAVAMARRPPRLVWPHTRPLPGPLKILVTVGAPDEGKTASNVLDHERELQNILDAIEAAERDENVEIRVLEASDPATLREALHRDQYHVLYITGHGLPGALELDDEEGNAVQVTAAQLVGALRDSQRPAPLVFLNTCHGGVDQDQSASLAEALLRGGVPAVLAMQTSVSDAYGTALARAFFEEASSREGRLASRALAHARRELERARREAVRRGEDAEATLPEYATATLFVAGIEAPFVNFGADKQPLQARHIRDLGGRVPQLAPDDLIGRRRELRRTLWVLRPGDKDDETRTVDGYRKGVAAALVGIGGVGKSTVAGRAMRRLAEGGFLVASHVGAWDLGAIVAAVGDALLDGGPAGLRDRGKQLADRNLDDDRRLRLLAKTLADAPILLVLDDFEQNLAVDGSAFLDADVAKYLGALLATTRRGRVLITSRFPLPGFDDRIATLPIGPLSDADVRKLVLRLPGLRGAPGLRPVLRTIGNHPRMLELLDALVRGGVGRLPHVTAKLNALCAQSPASAPHAVAGNLDEAMRQALILGARDVCLDELIEIARTRGLADTLLQVAASNLPLSAAGVAHMLADGPADAAAVARIEQALCQLEGMSLVFRGLDGMFWVHRWTAEGLAQGQPTDPQRARWARAGRYRRWRVRHESGSVDDLIEAVRNFLGAAAWDEVIDTADAVFAVLGRNHQTVGVAAVASEVLVSLPVDHRGVPWLLVTVGDAQWVLGQGDEARNAYAEALAIRERLVAAYPDRADYQRGLSISHEIGRAHV